MEVPFIPDLKFAKDLLQLQWHPLELNFNNTQTGEPIDIIIIGTVDTKGINSIISGTQYEVTLSISLVIEYKWVSLFCNIEQLWRIFEDRVGLRYEND